MDVHVTRPFLVLLVIAELTACGSPCLVFRHSRRNKLIRPFVDVKQQLSIDLTPVEDGGVPRIELVGIGAVLSGRGDALVIGQVMPAGGAAAAGIAPGDRIVGVDGVRVVELGFEPSIQRIRGPEGSAVLLDLRRGAGANERVETVRVERRRVVAP